MAAAKEKQGCCSQWLSEEHCSKGDSCSFRHDETRKEKERAEIQHDLFPETQTDLLKETAKVPKSKEQKASAHQGNETRQLATSTCTESARILLVIVGILLSVPNTEQTKKGASSAKSVPSFIPKTKTVKGRSQRTLNQTRQQPPWYKILNSWDVFLGTQNSYAIQRVDLRTRDDPRSSIKSSRNHLAIRFCRNAVKYLQTRERKGPSLVIVQGGSRNDRDPSAPRV